MLEAIDDLLNWKRDGVLDSIVDKSIEFHGLAKRLEIIGEAAYMLTDDFKAKHPQTDWRSIVAMRHLLVHGYYNAGLSEMLYVVDEDLPGLREQIIEYLSEDQA